MTRLLLSLLLLACLTEASVANPPATPQRPSFSADTSTTSPGTLELEAGFFFDDAEGRDTPLALKWGATDRTELFVAWSPFLQVADGVDGAGDTTLGIRTRFREEGTGAPSFAFQLAGKLPTADDEKGLGSGDLDLAFAGILTKSAGEFGLVGYIQSSVLGNPADGSTDLEHALAVAAARGLADRLSGFVELTATHNPDLDASSVFSILGLGYSISPSFVLDGSVVVGLGGDANDTLAGSVGITANLGSLGLD